MQPRWCESKLKFLATLVPKPLPNTLCLSALASRWVVATSELVAGVAMHDKSDSELALTAHLDVPVAPGTYQLAIATKNATTGDAGVHRTQINVPTYESLGTKN